MPKKQQIAYHNQNFTGWWIFNEVQQWVSNRQKELSPKSRCLVWENTRLIRAESREEAYEKAMKLCAANHPSKTNGGEWRFAGISMLVPVCEEIEDDSELLWFVHRMTVDKIKKLVKTKKQLPVFDDTEEPMDYSV